MMNLAADDGLRSPSDSLVRGDITRYLICALPPRYAGNRRLRGRLLRKVRDYVFQELGEALYINTLEFI